MKLLVYSDLQASESGERAYHQPDCDLQTHRVRLFFERLQDLYTKHGCQGLIDLGDTFDDRSAISLRTLDTVLAGLERLPEGFDIKLVGNHDQFLRNGQIHNGRLFRPRFIVPDTCQVVEFEDLRLFLVSYPDRHEDLVRWLDTESLRYRNFRKVLLGHFQVVGATLHAGTEAATGVPRELLSRFDLSLLGHIHLPQSLGSRIHYVGSPFEQNWGESGQPKRVGLLDLRTLKLEWIPLEGFPVYRRGSLETFLASYDPTCEDRWKVVLQNHAESERFYRLPDSARFEAVYAYDTQPDTPRDTPPTPQDWSLEASMARWLETTPPQLTGIETPPAELLTLGRGLVADV